MKNRIITISREFGSGGRTIGREVAKKLNIPCYDQELIDRIAEKSGYDKAYIQERGEYTASGSWLGNALAMRDFYGQSDQDKLWAVQRAVILELAEQGPCVIVGRCADYILRERGDVLNVFVHATVEYRERRILEQYGEREGKTISERLEEKDKKRMLYYKHYTDRDWGDIKNYHLTVNTAVIPEDMAVNWIVDAVR